MRIFKVLLLTSLFYACGDDTITTTEREVSSCLECTSDELCLEVHGWFTSILCVIPPSTCTPGEGNCACVIGPCGTIGMDYCEQREEALACYCIAC